LFKNKLLAEVAFEFAGGRKVETKPKGGLNEPI